MQAEGGHRRKSPPVILLAAGVLLLLSSAGGGGILAWWFLSFHPDNERLWMVPLGLVIFGAPLIAFLSISFSPEGCRRILLRSPPQAVAAAAADAES